MERKARVWEGDQVNETTRDGDFEGRILQHTHTAVNLQQNSALPHVSNRLSHGHACTYVLICLL